MHSAVANVRRVHMYTLYLLLLKKVKMNVVCYGTSIHYLAQ